MIGAPSMLYGMQVVVSPYAEKLASGKVFPVKKWMRGRCYPARQQKKNDHKFGPVRYEPAMYFINSATVCVHPLLMPRLREALGRQGVQS